MQHIFRYLLIFILFGTAASASERLVIRGGNDSKIGIELSSFDHSEDISSRTARKLKKRITRQLEDTELFSLYEANKLNSSLKHLFQMQLKKLNSAAKLELSLETDELSNEITATIKIYDIFIKDYVLEEQVSFYEDLWYRGAAQISDLIYYHFTGLEGYLDTRLVYISEKGSLYNRNKRVALMSLYGDEHQYITNGKNLVLTPRLSPDGKQIIYLSYSADQPKLYLLDLEKMKNKKLLDFKGLLYAPRFSPDGTQIVMAATYNGNSEIVLFDLEKKKLKRLTHDLAIDTSPSFSPAGNRIVFSSDRDGSQQLYIMDLNGDSLTKIKFDKGNYANPVWSPDGKYIAFTKIYQGKFHIGVLNMYNYESKILTTGYKDESPSWSPNGKFIIFSRKKANRKKSRKNVANLYLVNLNGVIIKKIDTPDDASDPDWVKL